MRRVGPANFVSGAGLLLVLTSPFYIGEPLHQQGPIFATTLARQHREWAMAGTITSIQRCEKSLSIRGICTTYCACPARPRWGRCDRSVAHRTGYFLGGAPA